MCVNGKKSYFLTIAFTKCKITRQLPNAANGYSRASHSRPRICGGCCCLETKLDAAQVRDRTMTNANKCMTGRKQSHDNCKQVHDRTMTIA